MPGFLTSTGPGRARSFGVLLLGVAAVLAVVAVVAVAAVAGAAEVMPPAPARYFNDYAGVTSAAVREGLNRRLEEFEKTDSSQVVVAVFPKMESPSSIEDYVHRMFVAWKVGREGKNNGVLLAVFVLDRRLRIEVGYGMEGALPDAIARRIIDNEIAPHFKQGNYDAGLTAGVNSILAATRGEYKGTGRTIAADRGGGSLGRLVFNRYFPWNLIFGWIVLHLLWANTVGRLRRRGTQYDRRGRRRYDSGWGWDWGGGWGGGGGGGWGGGGGGGGFSGGGGSSGGGGASGSW